MAGGRLQQQAITLASSSSFSSPLRAKSSLPLHRLLSSSSLSPHASFACRAFSSLSGVHTPQTRKTLGATSQRNSEMRHTHRPAAARTLRFLPSHQRFLHSSSSASSSFSLLSLTSPLSPSSTAFLKHIEYPTQQYRTIVTKIKSSNDFSSFVKEGVVDSRQAVKEQEEGKGSSSASVEGERNPLKIVQFSASWCFPCKQISPVVEKWSERVPSKQVQFFHVDIDECQDLAEEYDISSVPTFLFFKDGKQIKQVTGGDAGKLKAEIDEEVKKMTSQ